MRILQKTKDGGPESTVDAYFLIEIKSLFSIALLKFNKGTREAFHTHAFNAWTWMFWGNLWEDVYLGSLTKYSKRLKYTPKELNHRVKAIKTSYAVTVRGPWSNEWTETKNGKTIKLTHGRKEV